MKLILFLGLVSVLTTRWVSSNQTTTATTTTTTAVVTQFSSNNARFMGILKKKLQNLWDTFAVQENESFIGRCFGVARKLKFAMPLIIFKLGVIVTILGFLTIFSLKTLGLLGLLVMLNVSGAMSKLVLLLSGKHGGSKSWSPPQNVHLHVHQNKDGVYDVGHTSSGWEDRLGKYGSSSEEINNIDSSILYNKLIHNGAFLRDQGYVDS